MGICGGLWGFVGVNPWPNRQFWQVEDFASGPDWERRVVKDYIHNVQEHWELYSLLGAKFKPGWGWLGRPAGRLDLRQGVRSLMSFHALKNISMTTIRPTNTDKPSAAAIETGPRTTVQIYPSADTEFL
jgi:hypothetical protein